VVYPRLGGSGVCASREAYFMCGAKTLPVKKMFLMIWKITARRSRYYDGPTHRNPLNNLIKVYATLFDQLRKSLKDGISEPILLSDLLSQSHAQMATNPKDAVYGNTAYYKGSISQFQ